MSPDKAMPRDAVSRLIGLLYSARQQRAQKIRIGPAIAIALALAQRLENAGRLPRDHQVEPWQHIEPLIARTRRGFCLHSVWARAELRRKNFHGNHVHASRSDPEILSPLGPGL